MLFCVTAQYTPQALTAMRENPNTNRREAANQMAEAAGGKVVSFYHTISEGPGAHVIFDVDPQMAAAMMGIATASGMYQNMKMTRLYTPEEVAEIRQKGNSIRAAFRPPGA